MNFQTEICTFRTSDNERLDGALFTPAKTPPDLALLFVHGVAMNFYLPPLASFGQELAHEAYASGPQRCAHCHFSLPSGGPGQQQARHVGAGNQEDTADGAQE